MGRRKKTGPRMPLLGDCGVFREMVERYFGFLEAYGVHRAPEYDYSSPVACTVAYMAKNFWISVGLDIRDDYVGVSIVTPDERRKDLYFYLKEQFGRVEQPPIRELPFPIERAIASWADLLHLYADRLFVE